MKEYEVKALNQIAQFAIVAFLSFIAFVWVEYKMVLPAIEKDIIEHLPTSAIIQQDTCRTEPLDSISPFLE